MTASPSTPGSASAPPDRTPARALHDARSDRLWVVVDAFPATADDVSVDVGPSCVRVTVDHPTFPDGFERVVSPPTDDRVFEGVDRAVVRNGVLTVTVDVGRAADGPS